MMNQELNKAINLRNSGKYKESNKILIKLVQKFPDDASINYQCATSFDVLGKEAKAVPFYESAINLGLHTKELEEAYLRLGSSLRTLGKYKQSKIIFEKAMDLFPDNRALQVFHAMTLYNLKEHDKAMELLLKCLANANEDKDIKRYNKAIEFYSDKLDEIWV